MANKNIQLKDGADNLFPLTKKNNILDINSIEVQELSSGNASGGQIPLSNGMGGIVWGTPSSTEAVFEVTYGVTSRSEIHTALLAHQVPVMTYGGELYYVVADGSLTTVMSSDSKTVGITGTNTYSTPSAPSYVSKNQGTINAGKVLGINLSGMVEPVSPGSGTVAWGDITGSIANQTDLATALGDCVQKSQGSGNAGKVLGIDNNGNVTPVTPSSGTAWGQITGILADQTDLINAIIGRVDIAQGVAHAGEFLVVGNDGNVTTVTMSQWQGGSY